jgi:hypothetical protein
MQIAATIEQRLAVCVQTARRCNTRHKADDCPIGASSKDRNENSTEQSTETEHS